MSSRVSTDLESSLVSPITPPRVFMFGSPEVNWDSLAKEAKIKVDKEIERRKLKYDNILAVKIGTMYQAKDLKREIEEDALDVKAVER